MNRTVAPASLRIRQQPRPSDSFRGSLDTPTTSALLESRILTSQRKFRPVAPYRRKALAVRCTTVDSPEDPRSAVQIEHRSAKKMDETDDKLLVGFADAPPGVTYS